MIELPVTLLGSKDTEFNKILEGILIIVILFLYLQWHSMVPWEVIESTFDVNQCVRKDIHPPTKSLTLQRYVGVSQKMEKETFKAEGKTCVKASGPENNECS